MAARSARVGLLLIQARRPALAAWPLLFDRRYLTLRNLSWPCAEAQSGDARTPISLVMVEDTLVRALLALATNFALRLLDKTEIFNAISGARSAAVGALMNACIAAAIAWIEEWSSSLMGRLPFVPMSPRFRPPHPHCIASQDRRSSPPAKVRARLG